MTTHFGRKRRARRARGRRIEQRRSLPLSLTELADFLGWHTTLKLKPLLFDNKSESEAKPYRIPRPNSISIDSSIGKPWPSKS